MISSVLSLMVSESLFFITQKVFKHQDIKDIKYLIADTWSTKINGNEIGQAGLLKVNDLELWD